MTRRRKDTKRAATSRKRACIRRPHDGRRQPDLLRGVLEDLELHAEIRESFRTLMEV